MGAAAAATPAAALAIGVVQVLPLEPDSNRQIQNAKPQMFSGSADFVNFDFDQNNNRARASANVEPFELMQDADIGFGGEHMITTVAMNSDSENESQVKNSQNSNSNPNNSTSTCNNVAVVNPSAMKRIKTHLRVSMAPTRTSDITLIAVEHDLSKLLLQDPSSVINEFATKGQRRVALL